MSHLMCLLKRILHGMYFIYSFIHIFRWYNYNIMPKNWKFSCYIGLFLFLDYLAPSDFS